MSRPRLPARTARRTGHRAGRRRRRACLPGRSPRRGADQWPGRDVGRSRPERRSPRAPPRAPGRDTHPGHVHARRRRGRATRAVIAAVAVVEAVPQAFRRTREERFVRHGGRSPWARAGPDAAHRHRPAPGPGETAPGGVRKRARRAEGSRACGVRPAAGTATRIGRGARDPLGHAARPATAFRRGLIPPVGREPGSGQLQTILRAYTASRWISRGSFDIPRSRQQM